MISDVPTAADRMPACSALRDGNDVKKSQPKRDRAVAHQVEEQDRQDRQAAEQNRQSDDHEDLVELLAQPRPARISSSVICSGGGHQYASRNLRVRKKPITLKTSVISSSTSPAAKMLW